MQPPHSIRPHRDRSDTGDFIAKILTDAEAGDPQALSIAGIFHLIGLGFVQEDYHEAHVLFRRAAEQDDIYSLNKMGDGSIYFGHFNISTPMARGTAQAVEAVEWYRKAAALDDADAQFKLGCCLQWGLGVNEINYTEAAHWLKLAVKQGHVGAYSKLAVLCADGLGVDRDLDKAMTLLTMAAKEGDAEAQNGLGELCLKNEAYVQAMEWFRQAANRGDAEAQKNIGRLYARGWGVSVNPSESTVWFDKAGQTEKVRRRWFSVGTSYNPYGAAPHDYLKVVEFLVKAVQNHAQGATNTLFMLMGKAATNHPNNESLEQKLVATLRPAFTIEPPHADALDGWR